DVDGAVLLLANRGRGGFAHLHALGRMDHGGQAGGKVQSRGFFADERFVPDEQDLEGPLGFALRLDGALDDDAGSEVAPHGVHPDGRPFGSIVHESLVPALTWSSAPPARSLLRPRSSRSDRTPGAGASAGCSGGKATGTESRASSSCGASCRGCSNAFSWVLPSRNIPFVGVASRLAGISRRPRRRSGTTRGFGLRRNADRVPHSRRGRAASWEALAAPLPGSRCRWRARGRRGNGPPRPLHQGLWGSSCGQTAT